MISQSMLSVLLILSCCLAFKSVKISKSNDYCLKTLLKDNEKVDFYISSDTTGESTKAYSLILNINVPISIEEISNANLIKIVNLECSDLECNYLAWKCLGYKFNKDLNIFALSPDVFPKWAAKYPEAPDLIGLQRNFSPEIDKPVRDASMNLMRSIPRDYKGGVRALESEGFKGYKLKELTPNKVRIRD
jgi:hypothetical protein